MILNVISNVQSEHVDAWNKELSDEQFYVCNIQEGKVVVQRAISISVNPIKVRNVKLYTTADGTPSHKNGQYKKHTLHNHDSIVVICKSGTCAPFNASHRNPTKFNCSSENINGVMPCGVLNWSLRPGSHAVQCHVQYVYKHAVWRLRYGLPDEFSYAK